MAKQPEQLSFAEMMAQMQSLKAAMEGQAQERVDEIKTELETLAQVTGKGVAELLGISTARPVAVSAPRATSSRRSTADEDPRKTEIKEKFAGQVILNPGVGKDYTVGSRGAFPVWVLDSYDDLLAGKLDAMPRDEYLNRGNEENKPEEEPGSGEQPET